MSINWKNFGALGYGKSEKPELTIEAMRASLEAIFDAALAFEKVKVSIKKRIRDSRIWIRQFAYSRDLLRYLSWEQAVLGYRLNTLSTVPYPRGNCEAQQKQRRAVIAWNRAAIDAAMNYVFNEVMR